MENASLEHLSAKKLADDPSQLVIIFMFLSNMKRCVPWPHRSIGNLGHLALSNQDLAAVLSISRYVIMSLQYGANVSHVINAAMYSATWMFF